MDGHGIDGNGSAGIERFPDSRATLTGAHCSVHAHVFIAGIEHQVRTVSQRPVAPFFKGALPVSARKGGEIKG